MAIVGIIMGSWSTAFVRIKGKTERSLLDLCELNVIKQAFGDKDEEMMIFVANKPREIVIFGSDSLFF